MECRKEVNAVNELSNKWQTNLVKICIWEYTDWLILFTVWLWWLELVAACVWCDGCCSWKNRRLLACHTTRKTSGKYPRVHCGWCVRLVMDSSVKFMKVCGTTRQRSPWKPSNLVSMFASFCNYCAIHQMVLCYLSCIITFCRKARADAKCIVITGVCLSVFVCLSGNAFLHCCTYFRVTLGECLGAILFVRLELIFKLVHGLCCCGSICILECEMLASACTSCIAHIYSQCQCHMHS